MSIFGLHEKFSYFTDESAVFKASLADVANSNLGHGNEFVHQDQPNKYIANAVEGKIEDLLVPLQKKLWRETPYSYRLYLEMSNGMVVSFQNGITGSDANNLRAGVYQRLDCVNYIIAYSENLHEKGRVVSYGNCHFHKYQGEHSLRGIQTINDGGRWECLVLGDTILPWETPEKYTVKPVKNRFTLDDLRRGMEAEGITQGGKFPFTGKGIMLTRDTGIFWSKDT